jgi:hypothetical protein
MEIRRPGHTPGTPEATDGAGAARADRKAQHRRAREAVAADECRGTQCVYFTSSQTSSRFKYTLVQEEGLRGLACVAFAQGAGAVSARRAAGRGGCRPSALAHARPAAGASERSIPIGGGSMAFATGHALIWPDGDRKSQSRPVTMKRADEQERKINRALLGRAVRTLTSGVLSYLGVSERSNRQGSNPIAAATSKNSKTSSRRSPPSYFATKDGGLPSRCATTV